MRWNKLDDENCPIARAMSVIGDRWTLLILRDCLRGVTRFNEFQRRLGCSRAIVSRRLSDLVEGGILEAAPYQTHPPRFDYRLSEQGRDLGKVLMMMSQWAETWRPKAGVPLRRRRHTACGHTFQPVLVCSECHEPIRSGAVEFMELEIPGVGPAPPAEGAPGGGVRGDTEKAIS